MTNYRFEIFDSENTFVSVNVDSNFYDANEKARVMSVNSGFPVVLWENDETWAKYENGEKTEWSI